jgi:hypothetical protein
MSLRTTIVAAVCLALLPIGCKRLTEMGKAARQASSSAAAESADPQEEKDAELSQKLEGYIDCLNRASRDAAGSKESYLMYIDEAKGPTGKEHGVWIRALDVSSCVQALDKAKGLPPQLPDVEATVVQYRAALEALVPLVKQAHDYYDQKNYNDDKWAKGKQMHAPLVAAFAKFTQANEPFEQKVVALNEGVQGRRLARLQKDPKRRLQYLIEQSAQDAKKLVKLAEVSELGKLNGPAFDAQLQAYEKDYSDLDQYVTAHKDEASKVLTFSIFWSAEGDYLKAAKELMRRKRDNKDFIKESSPSPKFVEGHPAKVLDKYNDLVDRLNGLSFRE